MSIGSRLAAWLGRDKAQSLAAQTAQAEVAPAAARQRKAAPKIRDTRGTLSRFDVRLAHVYGGMRLEAIRRFWGREAARWAAGGAA